MIGYYAHHHGSGHVARAASIARALRDVGESTTVLSSRDPLRESAVDDSVSLPLDVDTADSVDATAGGFLHWAPTDVTGLTERMAVIAEWLARHRPRLVVVDVSVEVALFVRLAGIPVVVIAMPGTRGDPVHRLAYDAATAIVAPWSQELYDPDWLHPFAHKTFYVGAISRFEGRESAATDVRPNVLVLGGAGGTALTRADVDRAAAANPDYDWQSAGVDAASWIDDIWPTLCSASVVITHAGQNAIADIACAARPAIVVPQERPFGEQVASGDALASSGAAVVATEWPAPTEWQALIDKALALDPAGWQQLRIEGATARTASVLTERVVPR